MPKGNSEACPTFFTCVWFFIDCTNHWVFLAPSLLMPFSIFGNSTNLFSSFEQNGFKMHPLIFNSFSICDFYRQISKLSLNWFITTWSLSFQVHSFGVNVFLVCFKNFHFISVMINQCWVTIFLPGISFTLQACLKSDFLTRI